jgi:DNA-binding GntR family transcriptional regulator
MIKTRDKKALSTADLYTVLFGRIIDGQYAPGTRLKEEALADEFGVSRTPVREILRQLEQDGLVKIQPSCGASVTALTADDIEDLYDIRKLVELHALELAVSSYNLQRLLEFRAEIEKMLRNEDRQAHVTVDSDFHSYLVESTRRRQLIQIFKKQARLIERFRSLSFNQHHIQQRAAQEHLKIIDALVLRDAETAKALLRQHIETSKMDTLTQLCTGLCPTAGED